MGQARSFTLDAPKASTCQQFESLKQTNVCLTACDKLPKEARISPPTQRTLSNCVRFTSITGWTDELPIGRIILPAARKRYDMVNLDIALAEMGTAIRAMQNRPGQNPISPSPLCAGVLDAHSSPSGEFIDRTEVRVRLLLGFIESLYPIIGLVKI
jgi:hypothetical protein